MPEDSRAMVLHLVAIPACAWVAMTIFGCNAPMPRSGFLDDYAHFEKVADGAELWHDIDPTHAGRSRLHTRIWLDIRNAKQAGQYERFMVDPAVVRLNEDAAGKWEDPERVNSLAAYTTEALIEQLKKKYTIVDEPGEGVMRFRSAVTDAYPENRYRTPDTDNQPVKNYMNSSPGGGSFEGEAVDSVSGERIFAIIGRVHGTSYDTLRDQDIWNQTRLGISRLASFVRERIEEEHGQK